MPKAVYWMFVGALFRDSASKVLRHYRGLVDEVEREAEELARKELEEEENKQNYLENQDELDNEYEKLLALNMTRRAREEDIDVMGSDGLKTLVKTWSTGGAFTGADRNNNMTSADVSDSIFDNIDGNGRRRSRITFRDRMVRISARREAKRIAKIKQRALKEAAKVVVDYRPVMSAIINDYLFRCKSLLFIT